MALLMSPTECVTEQTIRDNITRAVSDVFATMLGHHPRLLEDQMETSGQSWPPLVARNELAHTPHVVGTVGFIGEANGLIYIYLPDAFARLVTCRLLGLTETELANDGEAVVNDAVGELTNMIVGVFKNCLCDSGYPCRLTIPSILRGNNFHIESTGSAVRRIYYFDCVGHRVVADIMMKIGE